LPLFPVPLFALTSELLIMTPVILLAPLKTRSCPECILLHLTATQWSLLPMPLFSLPLSRPETRVLLPLFATERPLFPVPLLSLASELLIVPPIIRLTALKSRSCSPGFRLDVAPPRGISRLAKPPPETRSRLRLLKTPGLILSKTPAIARAGLRLHACANACAPVEFLPNSRTAKSPAIARSRSRLNAEARSKLILARSTELLLACSALLTELSALLAELSALLTELSALLAELSALLAELSATASLSATPDPTTGGLTLGKCR
jgi:hypothetical protein